MDTKNIIAENIQNLRISNKLTQLELAKKLNYSDKSVSKWERGESTPDISVLLKLADLFEVSLDYIVKERHSVEEITDSEKSFHKKVFNNRAFITGMCIVVVWVFAAIAFITVNNIIPDSFFPYIFFMYAAVSSMVVWLVFNSIWFNKRRNYLIISFLMWLALASLHLSLLFIGINVYPIYVVGILGQIIIIFWSRLKY